jgi:hypothetical protein
MVGLLYHIMSRRLQRRGLTSCCLLMNGGSCNVSHLPLGVECRKGGVPFYAAINAACPFKNNKSNLINIKNEIRKDCDQTI